MHHSDFFPPTVHSRLSIAVLFVPIGFVKDEIFILLGLLMCQAGEASLI